MSGRNQPSPRALQRQSPASLPSIAACSASTRPSLRPYIAEEIAGETLESVRDDVTLCTKFGFNAAIQQIKAEATN
jgi:hypothetical protein